MVSSSLQICALLSSLYFLSIQWKENWLRKISISLVPGEISELKGSNEGRIPFNLLFASTMVPFNHCFGVKFSSNRQWLLLMPECLDSSNDLMIWFSSRDCVLSWNLPLSFCNEKESGWDLQWSQYWIRMKYKKLLVSI